MVKILGIDPGLNNTGWGVIEYFDNRCVYISSGVIKTSAKEDDSCRLLKIHDGIAEVVKTYQPTKAAIEQTYVNNNFASSLKLAQARGAAILTLATQGLFPAEYQAKTIKKAVVGSGRADKTQMVEMLKFLLPGSNIANPDAADATAIAICHAHYGK